MKKGGCGVEAPSLGCFCAYIGLGGCRGISALLFSPPKNSGSRLLGGWKGFAQVFFIDNHTKSKSYFSDFRITSDFLGGRPRK